MIGDPIAQSKSPLIHRFWLEKLGIAGDYRRTRVADADLAAFLTDRNGNGDWRGCNVTIPHKRAVMPLLDRIDPLAAMIGAVNTIRMEDWLLVGYNTDAGGFMEPLLPFLKSGPRHRFASLVGCGGAALAVAAALDRHDFTLIAFNRDPLQAKKRLGKYLWDDDLNLDLASLARPGRWSEASDEDRIDLLINATSLGMIGQPTLHVNLDILPTNTIVYDIVYAPLETPLLAGARARGFRAIDGLEMLIGQAAIAFALFFGAPAPREHDAELRALLTA